LFNTVDGERVREAELRKGRERPLEMRHKTAGATSAQFDSIRLFINFDFCFSERDFCVLIASLIADRASSAILGRANVGNWSRKQIEKIRRNQQRQQKKKLRKKAEN
jgi:hypothetical protein